GLRVLGQRQRLGRALPHGARELFAECRIDLLEHRTCRRKGIGEGLAHADCLAALPRKNESERHSLALKRSALRHRDTRPVKRRRRGCGSWNRPVRLAFSLELRINPASARSWLGTERTAAWPSAVRQDPMVRRPVFPPSEHSSLSRKVSKGFAPGGAPNEEGHQCRSTNTSFSRARTRARSRLKT